MLKSLLLNAVYVKVFANRFELRLLEEGARPQTVMAEEPFSTERLLVGQFSVAERILKKAIKELYSRRWFAPSPVVIIQPMEKIAGGLSEIEERALRELAVAAGARKAVVWVGHELSDAEAKQRAADA
jgi:actin-like ATPase involved in cell morphogenesis